MPNPTTVNVNAGEQDVLKQFQLDKLSVEEKSDKEFGLKISKKIWSYVLTGFNSYYYNRNARFFKNRNFANGRMDIQAMFQDRFEMNGKQNYNRLVWQTLQIVNRIVSGLVGRWMGRGEKIQVTATDSNSVKDKEREYQELEFFIENKERLLALQEQSGIQMMPQQEGLPTNPDELNLWQAQFQRLPEEIVTELGCNEALGANGWYDTLKEKMLHDAAETLLVGTYTWMDKQGVIHIERVKPENMIYSYTEYDDMRDTTWRGIANARKISELRQMWGKEFNPDNPNALTEQQLWQIAQTAKEYQYNSNLQWLDNWINSYLRPYDEWNVRTIEFELKTVDTDSYTVTKSKSSATTYVQKGLPRTSTGKLRGKPSDNQQVIADTNWNIYRGVYLPDNNYLIEWGLKNNMIRPQDPRETGNAEFSYSYYMPQNYQMRNLAIPEKIEAAVDGMILALLKMQQIMARLVPAGWAIDESRLDNIDYGLADSNKNIDHAKLYFQTGLLYFRGIDADGARDSTPPIHELANNGFVGQMQGLIANYQFNYQTLKDELGEDPNLISSALQPRVTGKNVEASQINSEYATDYIYRAYAYCMADTARKVSCLLKDSVLYGSKVYRHILKEEDLKGRIFSTSIKFLPTEQEVAKFEAIMNETIATNKDIILFIDPFRLMRIAKEDVKLAETLFQNGQKKCLAWQRETAMQNSQMQGEIQVKSAQEAEAAKQKTEEVKGGLVLEKVRMEGESLNKNAVISMVASLLSKGTPIPADLQPLVSVVVENMIIPMATQNEEQKAEIMQQMQQARMPQQEGVQEQGSTENIETEQSINQEQPQVAA